MNEKLIVEIVDQTPIEQLIPLFADLACFVLIEGEEDIPLVRTHLQHALKAKPEISTQLVLRLVERLHSAGVSAATIDALFGLRE